MAKGKNYTVTEPKVGMDYSVQSTKVTTASGDIRKKHRDSANKTMYNCAK